MEIVNAYAAVGSYRGVAAVCGTTHKTVKRGPERLEAGQLEPFYPDTCPTLSPALTSVEPGPQPGPRQLEQAY
jgi:hypothetical protein